MKRVWVLRVLAGVLVLVLLLVVACAKATPTPTPKPTATATPTKVAAPTATPVPAATPTVPVAKQTAKITLAMPTIFTGTGYDWLLPYFPGGGSLADMGVVESLWRMTRENSMTPEVMESFELSPDGTKFIVKIKQGIPFYSPPGLPDFGELTAEDIVWMQNMNNPTTNSESTCQYGGNLAGIYKEATVIDKYTLEIESAVTTTSLLGVIQYGVLKAQSKKAFETMGEDWAKRNVVATGPFVLRERITGVRNVVEAVPNHWRKTAQIKEFELIEMPEASSQVAALKTGEIDAAYIDFKVVRDLVDAGFVFLDGPGGHTADNISAIMCGNYWEEFDARTGEALEPWTYPSYEKDYPWIGNPWGDRVPYSDTDNPPGIDDMEQARLVRWALSMAIDREAIVEEILHGMGGPMYIEYISPTSILGGWDDNWKVDYDPVKAREYLTEAGYPNGFDLAANSYAAEIGPVALEIADAVTTMWRDIGVKATQERVDYGAVVAPKMISREQLQPVFKNCDVFCNYFPLDWPFPHTETSLTRPGWGCCMESPYLAEMVDKIKNEPSEEKRVAMHTEVIDYMSHEMLIAGIIERPNGVVVDPAKIKSWESSIVFNSPWHFPENIVLAD